MMDYYRDFKLLDWVLKQVCAAGVAATHHVDNRVSTTWQHAARWLWSCPVARLPNAPQRPPFGSVAQVANVRISGYAIYRSRYNVTRSYYYRCAVARASPGQACCAQGLAAHLQTRCPIRQQLRPVFPL